MSRHGLEQLKSCAQHFSSMRPSLVMLIDLSHPLEDGQPNYPGDPEISIVACDTVESTGYNLTRISMSSHQGTHLDVPFHFFDDGKTLDEVSLDRFYGPARLVDLAPGTMLSPKALLTVEMFAPHAEAFQPGAKVIYRTGWDRMFGSPDFLSESPSLTLEAARWIASRKISLLGMDTLTPTMEHGLECHHVLLGKGAEIIIVEGLANLHLLPPVFTFIGFPLNIKGRDGSPIRAVAVVAV